MLEKVLPFCHLKKLSTKTAKSCVISLFVIIFAKNLKIKHLWQKINKLRLRI